MPGLYFAQGVAKIGQKGHNNQCSLVVDVEVPMAIVLWTVRLCCVVVRDDVVCEGVVARVQSVADGLRLFSFVSLSPSLWRTWKIW